DKGRCMIWGRTRKLLERIMAALDDLEAKVAAQSTVLQSAVTLLTTIGDELRAGIDAKGTARLEALSAKIDNDTQALAAAVSRNTPAGNGDNSPDANPVPTPPAS